MAIDISQRIIKIHPTLSKSHKKIANAVLQEYEKVAYLTATQLAKKVNVSESTVVRFAAILGYEKYSEFRLAVQELVKTRLTPNQRIEITKQRIGKGDMLSNVMNYDINKIKYTLEHIDRDAFYDSVKAILDARNIYIIGARSSEPLARILQYNLSLIFDNVKFVSAASTEEVLEQMFSIGSYDVLVAFSFPRYSSKVVKAIKFAESKGAKTIAITDSVISPIVQYSTYALLAQSDMASFMDSLVAPVSIINSIIVEITQRREKAITKRFDTLEKIWDEYDVYTKK